MPEAQRPGVSASDRDRRVLAGVPGDRRGAAVDERGRPGAFDGPFHSPGLAGLHTQHNGPEFTAKKVREWLERIGVQTLFIEPGSPWENGYNESFNGKLRDELLDREIFDTLQEAEVLTERWRWEYNTIRPHSALGYRAPAPEAVLICSPSSATLRMVNRSTRKNDPRLN